MMSAFSEITNIVRILQRRIDSDSPVIIQVVAQSAEQFLKTLEDTKYIRILKTQCKTYTVKTEKTMTKIEIGNKQSVKSKNISKYTATVLPSITGTVVLSTPKGVMSHEEARKTKCGGRVLAVIY